MSWSLLLAAGYNVLWGAAVVLMPFFWFDHWEVERPTYPELWQCVGMIVGVYGIGYLIASVDPLRHWPIVFVGLLGKVLGPIGFLWSLGETKLPPEFGYHILFNDLIWWVPFFFILRASYLSYLEPERVTLSVSQALERRTDLGERLLDLSERGETLLLLLRHAGCTFCRESLLNLRDAIAQQKLDASQVVCVHMGDEQDGRDLRQRFHLEGVHFLSDSDRELYRVFGLTRGSLQQLFGLPVWLAAFRAMIWRGAGIGWCKGDGFQLGGRVLLKDGAVLSITPDQDARAGALFSCKWEGSPAS
jgi:hypothetical protein